MILPALIGYLLGFYVWYSNINRYASTCLRFSGSPQSMLKQSSPVHYHFTICMILGTLTVSQPILFGLLLLIVVTIPYYTFNALKSLVHHRHSF